MFWSLGAYFSSVCRKIGCAAVAVTAVNEAVVPLMVIIFCNKIHLLASRCSRRFDILARITMMHA